MPKKDKITIEYTEEELNALYELVSLPVQIIKQYKTFIEFVQPLYKTTLDKILEIENILNTIEEEEEA